jgi:hypothetical protein
MPLTPLQEIESSAHSEFGDQRPKKETLAELIVRRYPKMDGGISIALILAGLVLQGWQTWEGHKALRIAEAGQGNRCPKCGRPSIGHTKTGKFKCARGDTWGTPTKP